MRLLAAGHAADQQRRRREQLRDGRARQADPHVRCRRGRTTGGSSSALGDGRASASRRSTTSCATWIPRRSLIADPAGPLGDRRRHGRRRRPRSAPATTDVVVESAIFDPVSIRRTAFRYALRSEASLRFEKGQESRLARLGADRTARLIAEWAGGTVAPGAVDTNPVEPPPTARRVPTGPRQPAARDDVRDRRAARPAGPGRDRDGAGGRRATRSPSPPARSRSRSTPGADEVLEAIVPTWRRDLAIEADITEEVARVRGYELDPAIAARTRRCRRTGTTPLELRDAVRETLAGAGLTEVVTSALVSPRMVERFPARR